MRGLFSDAVNFCKKLAVRIKAKFHYTDPTGPARTLSETRTDQRSFSEIRVVRVRAGPRGSGRVRVVEFSYKHNCKSDDGRTDLLTQGCIGDRLCW